MKMKNKIEKTKSTICELDTSRKQIIIIDYRRLQSIMKE